ncbi:hypothetical protein [Candidatus Carsonella ruddii]|uniref:Uncharacterized protein n=1 Tax=Carsonella ruddii TaxID=114186 RepID=A0AAE7KLC8_CARRU|nr:hypothetical protein [Candidatus Carsonella ruddii]AGS06543.1 hypothetical protein CRDC_00280 [Candidatus Carsonella ruddii DC]ALA96801.1 hypothetical protein AMC76_00290 [Candidatus Carsonella ruddii]QLK14024.1 hypothetical protein FK493_00280 [Candidatus Carsonella ruddii]
MSIIKYYLFINSLKNNSKIINFNNLSIKIIKKKFLTNNFVFIYNFKKNKFKKTYHKKINKYESIM